jgi:hypothetical protein
LKPIQFFGSCPDCGAEPGGEHNGGCDVERCPACGGQFLFCGCDDRDEIPREPWSGIWPGVLECREYGLWARRNPDGPGYIPCGPDDPGAGEDLNTLAAAGTWNREKQRFEMKAERN